MIKKIRAIFLIIFEILFAFYRDFRLALILIKSMRNLKEIAKHDITTAQRFRQIVKKTPNKACILFGEETWTFQDIEDYSNKIANLFANKFDLKKGDCVSLFMENKPEYVCIWLGLSKLGVITALINTNLRADSLLYTLTIAKSKCIIYGSTLESAIETIRAKLNPGIELIADEPIGLSNRLNLKELLKNITTEIVEPSEKITSENVMLYIYTSGTTGLPKPAVIKESRFLGGTMVFFELAGLTPNDVVLVTLPIYHGNGGIIGIGSAICSGATVVLRQRFSASKFWMECIQYKCTAFVYVGELCRFLVNQPASPLDKQHHIRKAIGNGLRQNVWSEFYKRFGVKCVEFYAASEGNCNMINTVSRIGSCGFVPLVNRIFPLMPIYLIRIDDQMNPIRDENGFCVKCKPGEKGLLIGIIGKKPERAYNGYANNEKESMKKIIENPFKNGQRAFNSGDLMVCDAYGYMQFCDRIGDTYRWKGENIATVEVENVISKNVDSAECAVYGVEIPGQEGKAGMAAIKINTSNGYIKNGIDIDLKTLSTKLKTELPAYANPIFIRLVEDLEHTGTYKTKKNKLVEENYNVKVIVDKVFYFDLKEQNYVLLTNDVYENILNGNIRL